VTPTSHPRPVVSLSLDWHGDLRFRNSAGSPAIDLASSTADVTSPPQALAYAVMACMGMDVVHVLEKGRHELREMSIRFEGERASEHPRRFLSMRIHFDITGQVEDHVVERAIELSRTRYCSVWNTLQSDVVLKTTFSIHAD
jgi:putative redox protein